MSHSRRRGPPERGRQTRRNLLLSLASSRAYKSKEEEEKNRRIFFFHLFLVSSSFLFNPHLYSFLFLDGLKRKEGMKKAFFSLFLLYLFGRDCYRRMLDFLRSSFSSPSSFSSCRFLHLPSSHTFSLSSLLLLFLVFTFLSSSLLSDHGAASCEIQEHLSLLHKRREDSSSPLLSAEFSSRQDEEGRRERIEKKEEKEEERPKVKRGVDREKKGEEEENEEEEVSGVREVVEIPLWMVPKQEEIQTKRKEEGEEEGRDVGLHRSPTRPSLHPSSSLKHLFLFPNEHPSSHLSHDFLNEKKTHSSSSFSSSSFPSLSSASSFSFSSAFQLQLLSSSFSSSSSSPLEIFLSRLFEDVPRLLPNIQVYNLPLHVNSCTFFSLPSVYLKASTRYGFKESHLGQAPVDDLRVYVHGTEQICEAAYQAFIQHIQRKRNTKKKRKREEDVGNSRKIANEKKESISPKMKEEIEEDEEEEEKEEEDFRFFSSWVGGQCSPFLSSFFGKSSTSSLYSLSSSSLSLDRDHTNPSSSLSCSLPASSSLLLSALVSPSIPPPSLFSSHLYAHNSQGEEEKKKKKEDSDASETHEEGLKDLRCMWRSSGELSLLFSPSSSSSVSSTNFFSLLKTFKDFLLNKILPHTYTTNTDRLLSHAEYPDVILLPFTVSRKKDLSFSLDRTEEGEEEQKKTIEEKGRRKERREQAEDEEERRRRNEVKKLDSLHGRDRYRQDIDRETSRDVSSRSLPEKKEREEEEKERKEEEEIFSSSSSFSTERDDIYLVEVCSDRRGRSFNEVYIHLPFMFNLVFLVYPYGLAPVAYTVIYSVLLASILTSLSLFYIFPHYRLGKLR